MVVPRADLESDDVDFLEPSSFPGACLDRQLDVKGHLWGTGMAQQGQAPDSSPSCAHGQIPGHYGRYGACAFGLGVMGFASLVCAAGSVHDRCRQVMADGSNGLDLR